MLAQRPSQMVSRCRKQYPVRVAFHEEEASDMSVEPQAQRKSPSLPSAQFWLVTHYNYGAPGTDSFKGAIGFVPQSQQLCLLLWHCNPALPQQWQVERHVAAPHLGPIICWLLAPAQAALGPVPDWKLSEPGPITSSLLTRLLTTTELPGMGCKVPGGEALCLSSLTSSQGWQSAECCS